ncbi:hypothetical protein, partial [Streptomyces sp. NPDC003374]
MSEPLEPVKSALPPYVAVTAYGLPAVPVYVCAAVAVPPATGTVTVGEPSPKEKVTVPDGVPAPGATAATVAVNVT